jgi:hypothetical protein
MQMVPSVAASRRPPLPRNVTLRRHLEERAGASEVIPTLVMAHNPDAAVYLGIHAGEFQRHLSDARQCREDPPIVVNE